MDSFADFSDCVTTVLRIAASASIRSLESNQSPARYVIEQNDTVSMYIEATAEAWMNSVLAIGSTRELHPMHLCLTIQFTEPNHGAAIWTATWEHLSRTEETVPAIIAWLHARIGPFPVSYIVRHAVHDDATGSITATWRTPPLVDILKTDYQRLVLDIQCDEISDAPFPPTHHGDAPGGREDDALSVIERLQRRFPAWSFTPPLVQHRWERNAPIERPNDWEEWSGVTTHVSRAWTWKNIAMEVIGDILIPDDRSADRTIRWTVHGVFVDAIRQWNAMQQDIETVARTALHVSFSVPVSLTHGQTPLDGTQQRMHITWSVTAASDNDLDHAFAELDGWLSQSHNKR